MTVVTIITVYFLCLVSTVLAQQRSRMRRTNSTETQTFLNSGKFDLSNPHAVEQLLVYAEHDRAQDALAAAKKLGYEIHGFYHTSKWRDGWKDVITDQIKLLDGQRKVPVDINNPNTPYEWDSKRWTSLLGMSDGLYMNVAGTNDKDMFDIIALVDSQNLVNRNKIAFNFNYTIDRMSYSHANEAKKKELDAQTHLSEGEYSTVSKLHDYCDAMQSKGKKALVYYMHSKGLCCPRRGKEKNPVASWRELMNAYIVEFPSICMRAILQKGYSACGANNQDAHFSGKYTKTETTCKLTYENTRAIVFF
jgi:hypothetical protein